MQAERTPVLGRVHTGSGELRTLRILAGNSTCTAFRTISFTPSGLKAEHCPGNTFPPDFLLNRVPDGKRTMHRKLAAVLR